MSSEGNDFLSRWSRRKTEMRREKPPVAAPAPVASPEPEDVQAVSGEEVEYTVGLPGEGAETEVFFSDLSHEYVTINADYTT